MRTLWKIQSNAVCLECSNTFQSKVLALIRRRIQSMCRWTIGRLSIIHRVYLICIKMRINLLLFPNPLRETGARKETMQLQKLGISPRFGPEVEYRRVAKEQAAQRVPDRAVLNEIRSILGRVPAVLQRFSILPILER